MAKKSWIQSETNIQSWWEQLGIQDLSDLSEVIRWELKSKNESLMIENQEEIFDLKKIMDEKLSDNEFVKILNDKIWKNKRLTIPMKWIMIMQTVMNILWIKWRTWKSLAIDAFFGENSYTALTIYQKKISWIKSNWLFDKTTLDSIKQDLKSLTTITDQPKPDLVQVPTQSVPVQEEPIQQVPVPTQVAENTQSKEPKIAPSHEPAKPDLTASHDRYIPESYRWLSKDQITVLSKLDKQIFQGFRVRFNWDSSPAADTDAWNKKFDLLTKRGRPDLVELEKWYYNFYKTGMWNEKDRRNARIESIKHLDAAIAINPKLADAYLLKWQLERYADPIKSKYYYAIWYTLSKNYILAVEPFTDLLLKDDDYKLTAERIERKRDFWPLSKKDLDNLEKCKKWVLSPDEKGTFYYHLALNYLWRLNDRMEAAERTKNDSDYYFFKAYKPDSWDMRAAYSNAKKYYELAQTLNPSIKDPALEREITEKLAMTDEQAKEYLS